MPDVLMPDAMTRFKCNQKGCCCQGWKIRFDEEDIVKLIKNFDEQRRGHILHDCELVVDDNDRVHYIYLRGEGPERRCQFLAGDGRCGVHAEFGIEPLPKLCKSFPVHAQEGSEGLELHYDAVCPEVINQIAEGGAPFDLVTMPAEPGTDLGYRTWQLLKIPQVSIGQRLLAVTELEQVRTRILRELGEAVEAKEMAIDVLARINYAMGRFARDEEMAAADFEILKGEPVDPFEEHFELCVQAHHGAVLAKVLYDYRRFIYAVDLDGMDASHLLEHMSWQPDWRAQAQPRAPELQPFLLRYLSHRFFSAFDRSPASNSLGFSYENINHSLATAFRASSGLVRWLERPVDMDIMKVGVGVAEFLYRAFRLPAAVMPWFSLEAPPVNYYKRVIEENEDGQASLRLSAEDGVGGGGVGGDGDGSGDSAGGEG